MAKLKLKTLNNQELIAALLSANYTLDAISNGWSRKKLSTAEAEFERIRQEILDRMTQADTAAINRV